MGVALFGCVTVIPGYVAYALWQMGILFPPAWPEILRDLPGNNIGDAAVELRKRLRQQFPDGSSEKNLVHVLAMQGFVTNGEKQGVL